MLTSEDIIKRLGLQHNDKEGGYFAGTYVSGTVVPDADLPGFPATQKDRPLCGAIYYFLDSQEVSVMHRVTGDMIYHFYSGDPVQMLLLYPPDKTKFPTRTEVCIFSNDIASGGTPMKVIPGGTWLGSRLASGVGYALMGVTMAPGFDPGDYSIGERQELIQEYREQQALIESLTR
ncbi:MAG: cupin domain-containing protein [Ferruginibacter sp.]